jgi:hypothetical protein
MVKKKLGQPPHVPTDLLRAKVEGFSTIGYSHEKIAAYIEINVDTLKKYYKNELDKSKMSKVLAMADSIYARGLDGDTKAAMFWLRTQAGWYEAKAPDRPLDEALPWLGKFLDWQTKKGE